MKRLASYLVFIISCGLASTQQSLKDKVIMFPELRTSSWAKLHPKESMNMSAVTVCMRFYTDQAVATPCLFSLATPSISRDLSLYWSSYSKQYNMFIHDSQVQFNGLTFNLNQWNYMCATWDAKSGLAQMVVNNVASIKKAVGYKQSFKGEPSIILGQFQTRYNGGFDSSYIFTGFISNVQMHKHILTPHEISYGMYTNGDYINWQNLTYTIVGSAQVEDQQNVT